MGSVFRAEVICPDDACAAAFDAVAELEELEALICDCGCTLSVERLSDDDAARRRDGAFELVALG